MKTPQTRFVDIPAVSILKGVIVLARNDAYETLTIDDKVPNTLDFIELLTEHYETIYITDVNGLIEGKAQVKLIREVSEFCEVWLDAGVAEVENIYDLFVAGAHEVVLSSKTLGSIMELALAVELSENLIFELDYDNGVVSPNGQIRDMSPEKLGSELMDIGIERVIFADLARIAKNKSLETSIIQSLINQGLKVYVGGGVKHWDKALLEKQGATGAILELVDVLQHGKVDL